MTELRGLDIQLGLLRFNPFLSRYEIVWRLPCGIEITADRVTVHSVVNPCEFTDCLLGSYF